MDFVAEAAGYVVLYVLGGFMGLGVGAWLAASGHERLQGEITELRRQLAALSAGR